MKRETVEYINELAYQIRKIYGMKDGKFSIDNVLKNMDIIVEEKSSMFTFASDKNIIKGNGKLTFYISENESKMQKKIDICMLLGNAVLHMGFCTDRKCWSLVKDGAYNYFHWLPKDVDDIDRAHMRHDQAVEFSKSLLLPNNELINEIKKNTNENDIVDMKKVEVAFDVSESYVLGRSLNLGLIK